MQPQKLRSRNADLISMRNKLLIYRYCFWYEIKRLRTDDVYDVLSNNEFFLHVITIQRIVRKNVVQIKEARTELQKIGKVIKSYPSFNWK